MKQLLNTLFVTSEDIYLSLEGENVLANRDKEVIARYPLHTLQSIVTFSYPGASPALMGACAEKGIGLAFCSPRGRFLARVCGESNGNVLLRRDQYRIADDPLRSCAIARTMIFGKLSNSAATIKNGPQAGRGLCTRSSAPPASTGSPMLSTVLRSASSGAQPWATKALYCSLR